MSDPRKIEAALTHVFETAVEHLHGLEYDVIVILRAKEDEPGGGTRAGIRSTIGNPEQLAGLMERVADAARLTPAEPEPVTH